MTTPSPPPSDDSGLTPWQRGIETSPEQVAKALSALDPAVRSRVLEPYIVSANACALSALRAAGEVDWGPADVREAGTVAAMQHAVRCIEAQRAELASARAEVERLKAELSAAVDIIDEYAAQWGDDYLAKKWELPEQTEQLKARIRELEGKADPNG